MTPQDIEGIISNILKGAMEHEDLINTIAGAAGVLPEVSLAEKALPALVAVLQFLQQQSGTSLSPMDALGALLSHIAPGMPNAPALSNVPEGS